MPRLKSGDRCPRRDQQAHEIPSLGSSFSDHGKKSSSGSDGERLQLNDEPRGAYFASVIIFLKAAA